MLSTPDHSSSLCSSFPFLGLSAAPTPFSQIFAVHGVAADGVDDCVELVHELGAVIILGGRIELESEIDVRVTGPDTITKPALPPPLQVSAATALCVR